MSDEGMERKAADRITLACAVALEFMKQTLTDYQLRMLAGARVTLRGLRDAELALAVALEEGPEVARARVRRILRRCGPASARRVQRLLALWEEGYSYAEYVWDPDSCRADRELLGLLEGHTPAEAKRAWRSLAIANHPDKGGDPEAFMRIQEAYDNIKLS